MTDNDIQAEYDIVGKDYQDLIRVCCKYSQVLSFVIMQNNVSLMNEIKTFEVTPDPLIFDHSVFYDTGHHQKPYKKFYKVCPEMCDALLNHTDSIFSWICNSKYNNPEDITFYRNDGSVFFGSIIHDGICMISNREDEDINSIISNPLWIPEGKIKGYWKSYLNILK